MSDATFIETVDRDPLLTDEQKAAVLDLYVEHAIADILDDDEDGAES